MKKILKESRFFMNTKIEITSWSNLPTKDTYNLFSEAFAKFDLVAKKFTRFDPKSELSSFNNTTKDTLEVSPELSMLIKKSLDFAMKTNGKFDPTIISILEAYGYDKDYRTNKISISAEKRKNVRKILKERAMFSDLVFLDDQTVIKPKRYRLDLGGIGKGYAIDLAYEVLKPLQNYLINAGGDIMTSGKQEGEEGWFIDLTIPETGNLGTILLKDTSICCSGSWARKVGDFHHLINPKTGNPENRILTCYVVSADAIDADGWATGIFCSGDTAHKVIEKYKLKAFVLYDNNMYISTIDNFRISSNLNIKRM